MAGVDFGLGGVGGANADYSGVDIETMVWAVAVKRMQLIDGTLGRRTGEVRQRTESCAEINEAMDALNDATTKFNNDPKKTYEKLSPTDKTYVSAAIDKAQAIAKKLGISLPSSVINKDKNLLLSHFTVARETCKSRFDNENSTNNIQMLDVQSLFSKRNETTEGASNVSKKIEVGKQTITSNMRG